VIELPAAVIATSAYEYRSVKVRMVPTLFVSLPTAVHAVADVHDTADRELPPVGLGVGSITHVAPFQASASVPAMSAPTAVHSVADVHDTADRELPPVGLDVGSITHFFPFQASASVTSSSSLAT